jgi:hypothetical protein
MLVGRRIRWTCSCISDTWREQSLGLTLWYLDLIELLVRPLRSSWTRRVDDGIGTIVAAPDDA